MSFSQWLRVNSEHYLLRDAQTRLAQVYGRERPPRDGGGVRYLFWSRFFVPVYRAIPWPVRRRVMQQIPGSHRKKWTVPPKRHSPAV